MGVGCVVAADNGEQQNADDQRKSQGRDDLDVVASDEWIVRRVFAFPVHVLVFSFGLANRIRGVRSVVKTVLAVVCDSLACMRKLNRDQKGAFCEYAAICRDQAGYAHEPGALRRLLIGSRKRAV